MKKNLLLLLVLFLLGGSIGIAKSVENNIMLRTEANSKAEIRNYIVTVVDTWKNNLIIYEETVCGIDNADIRAYELKDLFDAIYQPDRINIYFQSTSIVCIP